MNLKTSCLLIVDAQQGFTKLYPQELPVPGALSISKPINKLLQYPWQRIDATQDWHPVDHCSFKTQDGPYNPHCIAGTEGAKFIDSIQTDKFHTIWRKGMNKNVNALSLLEQYPKYGETLEGIDTVALCGLCTNICVFETAMHLRAQKFRVYIVEDASAGIDLPGKEIQTIKAIGEAEGIYYVKVSNIENQRY